MNQEIVLVWMTKPLIKAGLFWSAPPLGNTFITGQHIDPNNLNTSGNLSVEQMRGAPLTNEQREKFKFVINPDNTYNFQNLRKFTTSVEDQAMLNFLVTSYNRLAMSESEYTPVKHDGYLKNKFAEAKKIVENADMYFDAMTTLKASSIDKAQEVALFCDYKNADIDVVDALKSKDLLYAELYKVAKTRPEIILEGYNDESSNIIFILKLLQRGVLHRRDEAIYDKGRLIGVSVNDVVNYMSKSGNEAAVARWHNEVSTREGKTLAEKNSFDYDELVKEIKISLFDNNLQRASVLVKSGLKKFPEDTMLSDLRHKIDNPQDGNKKGVDYSVMDIDQLKDELAKLKFKGVKKNDYIEFYEAGDRESMINLIKSKA